MAEDPSHPTPVTPATVQEQINTLSTQGTRLMDTQKLGEAEAVLRRALALSEEKLGPNHPSTATCLSNLGEALRMAQRFADAEPLLRRALAISESVHGPDHPETAIVLNNLALVLRGTNRVDEAGQIYHRVLAIFEKTYGPDNVSVAGALNNLGQVLRHAGRGADAEPIFRRGVEIFEKHFGENHPNVAIALNNLAHLLVESGRVAEAEPLAQRQVRIFREFEKSTGQPHVYKDPSIAYYREVIERLGFPPRVAMIRIHAFLDGLEVGPLNGADRLPAGAVDFDRLATAAARARGALPEHERLWSAVFKLEQWHFVARPEGDGNMAPYIAANSGLMNGAPMLKVFTDTVRLQRFAEDNQLCASDGSTFVLSYPVRTVMEALDHYAQQGVAHIHFNPDKCSFGFYGPVTKLAGLEEDLRGKGLI
jgi:tetratricopeptide (TPR) repeat protein